MGWFCSQAEAPPPPLRGFSPRGSLLLPPYKKKSVCFPRSLRLRHKRRAKPRGAHRDRRMAGKLIDVIEFLISPSMSTRLPRGCPADEALLPRNGGDCQAGRRGKQQRPNPGFSRARKFFGKFHGEGGAGASQRQLNTRGRAGAPIPSHLWSENDSGTFCAI